MATANPPATASKLPELKPGMTVRVHQRIRELVGDKEKKEKERVQVFEGIILAYNRGKKPSPTIVVRKISAGVGVEKIFPVSAPTIVKIEPVKQAEVRRAKLYYLRTYRKRLTEKKIA
ncbi:MAG: 50S ribosomal protein L19 [Patescibacteria group bacterium]|nr:50S ribosomal protein L19 [Patescibacteria group bacterium]